MLSEEQIKEKAFTPEQIEVVNSVYAAKETELKSLANKNADGIFNGAAEKLKTLTGINKNEGEKYSTYFERLGAEWLPTASAQKITAAEEKVRIAEEKFANHKGDETLKADLQIAQEELKKIPGLLEAKDTEWKAKYDTLETKYSTTELNRSLKDSMPKFDDSVNQFELEAKKTNAIDRIKEVYELSFDDNGKLIGTKDYQKFLVSDLLKGDEELKDLILIDQDKGGGGAGNKKKTTVLSIPEGTAKGMAQNIIQAYIVGNEGIKLLDDKFSDRFKELCKENNVL